MLDELNPLLAITGVVWLFSEITKYLVRKSKGEPSAFGHPGGMPSGHTAAMTSATTVLALTEGWDSSVFGLAVVMTVLVMHDAVRLRWAVGQQALRLNELIALSKIKDRVPLMVWQGHRIREVGAGLVLGVGGSWLLYLWWYG